MQSLHDAVLFKSHFAVVLQLLTCVVCYTLPCGYDYKKNMPIENQKQYDAVKKARIILRILAYSEDPPDEDPCTEILSGIPEQWKLLWESMRRFFYSFLAYFSIPPLNVMLIKSSIGNRRGRTLQRPFFFPTCDPAWGEVSINHRDLPQPVNGEVGNLSPKTVSYEVDPVGCQTKLHELFH